VTFDELLPEYAEVAASDSGEGLFDAIVMDEAQDLLTTRRGPLVRIPRLPRPGRRLRKHRRAGARSAPATQRHANPRHQLPKHPAHRPSDRTAVGFQATKQSPGRRPSRRIHFLPRKDRMGRQPRARHQRHPPRRRQPRPGVGAPRAEAR
jgi:hypothetical protein